MLNFVRVHLAKFFGRGMSERKPERKNERLATGEYCQWGPIGARRELINAIKTNVPEFFEQLREDVYPAYAHASEAWSSEHDEPPTWMFVRSHRSQLKAAIEQWARNFKLNAEEEEDEEKTWILEGAVSLLWHWHRYPKTREALDVQAFLLPSSGGWGLFNEAEREFHFSGDPPRWNPQTQTWAEYNKEVIYWFKQELCQYKQKIRALAKQRKGVRVQSRYSSDDFKYFALYRFRGMSPEKIFQHLKQGGDPSTVRKGIKAAAKMLQMPYKTDIK
jgi:hypothetical protein